MDKYKTFCFSVYIALFPAECVLKTFHTEYTYFNLCWFCYTYGRNYIAKEDGNL